MRLDEATATEKANRRRSLLLTLGINCCRSRPGPAYAIGWAFHAGPTEAQSQSCLFFFLGVYGVLYLLFLGDYYQNTYIHLVLILDVYIFNYYKKNTPIIVQSNDMNQLRFLDTIQLYD
jgi:hypothetical protein